MYDDDIANVNVSSRSLKSGLRTIPCGRIAINVLFIKMASMIFKSEYGIPDRVLQTDLVPDWSAGEVSTGVSVSVDRRMILCVYYCVVNKA